MLRWLKKRGQRRNADKVIEKRDEYGFDITGRRPFNCRTVDHIYEEIAEVVNQVDSIPRHRVKSRPALPPRNNKLSTDRQNISYSKWKTKSLSRRTASLPELADTEENEDFVNFKPCQFSDSIMLGKTDFDIVSNQDGIFTRETEEFLNGSSINDLMIGFEKSSVLVSKNTSYLHPGSDSGYDYSCSSSNESDINDSGLSDCYEFHISKAEQLHRLERKIHLLACHSASNKSPESSLPDMSLDCSWQNASPTPLSNSVSVTPDLDLDDEISAYMDPKLHFRFSKPKPLSQKQPTPRPVKATFNNPTRNGCVRQPASVRQIPKLDTISTQKTMETLKPVDIGGITPYPKRALRGNSLLGDLIRKNNNNLFFT